MIINLFSIFDPSTFYIRAGWVVLVTPIIMLIGETKKFTTKKILVGKNLIDKIEKETNTLNGKDEKKSTSSTIKKLFILVIIVNIVAVLPTNFTPTAHISISVFIRLTIWAATMVNAVSNSIKSTIEHLTPIGTPAPLINFIVVIELIRNIIRPITLAVRLTANMVAGHLLMRLLSNFSIISNIKRLTMCIPIFTLITLEMAVALIQAYVITILICLYYKETF